MRNILDVIKMLQNSTADACYMGPRINRFHCPSDIKKKLQDLSPRANYTDRATAACRRSDCQLVRIEGATLSE
jgi:hypothetical protein